MDMIDVLLARAMTPQGQINTYAARAEKAVSDATQALNSITEIVQNLSDINNLEEFTDAEIGKLVLSLSNSNESNAILRNLLIQYPDDDAASSIGACVKYYTTTGQNTDGTMTQKAITDAINAAIQNGGGSIIPPTPAPVFNEASIGLNINYSTTKTATRIGNNAPTTSSDFDNFKMYGGRKRCLVNDEGEIQAFYGDANYTDTPNNGLQVMVYQPKFYYKRVPFINQDNELNYIASETLEISSEAKDGFTIHPLFVDAQQNELEYVLFSAYEGSIDTGDNNSYKEISYGDNFNNYKLASVSGAQPISGQNNELTVVSGEQLAQNRGEGWHILNSKALSVEQMLEMIEFGTLNLQNSFAPGICNNPNRQDYYNCSAITGATKNLGNVTGQANGTSYQRPITSTQNTNQTNSISYRGYENPWGNIWQLIGDLLIVDKSSTQHNLYICKNYNYNKIVNNNYNLLGNALPSSSGWPQFFTWLTSRQYLFIPGKNGDNSLGLIGDYYYGSPYTSGTRCFVHGGYWGSNTNNGLFYYACDKSSEASVGYNVNVRLMHIPQFNSAIYNSNITKWNVAIGG